MSDKKEMTTVIIFSDNYDLEYNKYISNITNIKMIMICTEKIFDLSCVKKITENVYIEKVKFNNNIGKIKFIIDNKDKYIGKILVLNDNIEDIRTMLLSKYRIEMALEWLEKGKEMIFAEGSDNCFWTKKRYLTVDKYQMYKNRYIINKRSVLDTLNIKIGAWYFPQYHQIPENDKFWGTGFTEWTFLRPAENVFPDQQLKKPHSDLGYYNILQKHTRKLQGDIANKYGVSFFCFYHYWFNGHQLMKDPIELMLKDSYPNIDFILEWANDPWTKRWDGLEHEILLNQNYGNRKMWVTHYQYLSRIFKSSKYMKINNSPIFIIYRVDHIGNKLIRMIKLWKSLARKDGFNDLIILGKTNHWSKYNDLSLMIDNKRIDGFVEFMPFGVNMSANKNIVNGREYIMYNTDELFTKSSEFTNKSGIFYRGWLSGWDNTPRAANRPATIFTKQIGQQFKNYLIQRIKQIIANPNKPQNGNYLFINAWNEWNEQAILEPNHINGYEMLEGLKSALDYFK